MVPSLKGVLFFASLCILNTDAWLFSRRRSCSKVNCRVSGWSTWSACSHSCGLFGQRDRRRSKLTSESCGGSCPYSQYYQKESCNNKCCPVDCVYSWGPWTSCSGCGSNGQQQSSRIITKDKKCGGKCDVPVVRTRACDTGK